jgi:COMPASS component SWD3
MPSTISPKSTPTAPIHSLSYSLSGLKSSISSLTFSPSLQYLLVSTSNTISLYVGLRFLRQFDGHKEGINDLSWHKSSTQFASASDDKTIKIWSLNGILKTLRGHTNYIISLQYNPNGNMIVSGGVDESIRLWQVDSGKPFYPDLLVFRGLILGTNRADLGNTIRIIQAHSDPISSVRFTNDGTLIVSSSFDGLV